MIRTPRQLRLGLTVRDRVAQRQVHQRAAGEPATRGPGRPKKQGAGLSHQKRETLARGSVLHITAKLKRGLPRLRGRKPLGAITAAVRKFGKEDGFRLVHFSVQRDHLHLIIETDARSQLSRAMQKLMISIARRLNVLWGEGKRWIGRIFKERYHEHVLRTPTEVRWALVYVLHNGAKHGEVKQGVVDPYSTAAHFAGYKEGIRVGSLIATEILVDAKTWPLTEGWKRVRGGLLSVNEIPKVATARS